MPSSGQSKSRAGALAGDKPLAAAASTLSLARVGTGLFLLSAAGLAFEVSLTHLFSMALQYHYAFLAVSSAVLGLGIGAALGYRLPPLSEFKTQAWLGAGAALVALAIPLAVLLFAILGFTPGAFGLALAGMLPFVAAGLFSARLYALYHRRAAWLYAFDLAGAAAGLVVVQFLLDWMSAASAAFILSLIAGTASLLLAGVPQKRPLLPFTAVAIAIIGLSFSLTSHAFDLPSSALETIPPDKTMFRLLADPASGSKLTGTAWSSFARVDLLTSSDPSQDFVFTNGGAGSYMIRFNGDLSSVNSLTQELEYLPFDQFQPTSTLVLGAGAGKDVLQALLAGSKQITAVEINPAMVALTRQYAAYNGGIFDYPGVQTVVADARNYVARSSSTYDMIYLNLVYAQAPTPGSNALSEAYIFTEEALRTYLQHLSPGGRLAILSHQGLEGSRALITALKALELEGYSIKEGLSHTALMMYNGDDPNQNTTVLIVQKSPLTTEQVQLFAGATQTLNLAPLFLPGIYESLLKDLADGTMSLDTYLSKQDYNLFPTTDDRPFFFALNPGLPEPLVILLGMAVVGVLLFLLLTLGAKSKPSAWQMLYFGGLGLGYMLIEVPLIQRTILLVGSPTSAIAVVLVSLLLGGGAGSFWSSRWAPEKLFPRLALTGALVALLAAALAIWQPVLVAAMTGLEASFRMLAAGLILVPLGFLMGIPFANGLRLAGEVKPGVLPFLWGWNALTAVLGSALAAVFAMVIGYSAGMLAGAACYVLVTVAALVQER